MVLNRGENGWARVEREGADGVNQSGEEHGEGSWVLEGSGV